MRQNRFVEALYQFKDLSRSNKTDTESRLKIGIISLRQGNYDDAIQAFTLLLKDQPQYDQALYYLGFDL